MFTDFNHLRVKDPGSTKDNPVFVYLNTFVADEHFAKYFPEYNNLDELKARGVTSQTLNRVKGAIE